MFEGGKEPPGWKESITKLLKIQDSQRELSVEDRTQSKRIEVGRGGNNVDFIQNIAL